MWEGEVFDGDVVVVEFGDILVKFVVVFVFDIGEYVDGVFGVGCGEYDVFVLWYFV